MAAMDPNHEETVRQTPFNLLCLPLELQIIIFKYALQEPILWDRRHRDGCNLRPTEEGVIEHPPWIWHRPIIDAHHVSNDPQHDEASRSRPEEFPITYTLANTWKFCECAKRTGINLLRTSRHVYSIAAPLFWSAGKFCFFDGNEFAACMTVTSPGTRALIRGVSIVSSDCTLINDMRVHIRLVVAPRRVGPIAFPPWCMAKTTLWGAVKLLTGLEYLAIPHDYVNFSIGESMPNLRRLLGWDVARRELPRLKFVELTCMTLFGGSENLRRHIYQDRAAFWTDVYRNADWLSFAIYSQCYDARIPEREIFERWRTLQKDFQIEAQIYQDLLTVGPRVLRSGLRLAPHPDLVGGCKTVAVQLRNTGGLGPKLDVTFCSLPLDKSACAKSKLALSTVPPESPQTNWSLLTTCWGQDALRSRCIGKFEDLITGLTTYPWASCDHGASLHGPCSLDCARPRGEEQELRPKRNRAKKNRRRRFW